MISGKNPGGIIEAAIDVEFFDSNLSDSTNTEQKFETAYVPQSESIVSELLRLMNWIYLTFIINYLKIGFVYNETLSGNPGYQINRPIVAGTFANGQLLFLSADV